jgi:hypothetical protein
MTSVTRESPGASMPGPRRRWWLSGPGTPSRCCSGSTRIASTATMSDGSPGWKMLLASLGALYRARPNARGGLLTWPDAPGLIPHIFRKLRLRAASGGIWLRTRHRAAGSVLPGQSPFGLFASGCPRQDSNLRSRLRRPLLSPLSYGGSRTGARLPAQRVPASRARRPGPRPDQDHLGQVRREHPP